MSLTAFISNSVASRIRISDYGKYHMPFSLGAHDLIAFVNILNVEEAKTFYRDVLQLRLSSEELPFALVFDANGIMLRLAINQHAAPHTGTALGWKVPRIEEAVAGLAERGVRFERYSFMPQDEQGIWTSPTGAKVAWFKDPDGNLLSLSEHPEA